MPVEISDQNYDDIMRAVREGRPFKVLGRTVYPEPRTPDIVQMLGPHDVSTFGQPRPTDSNDLRIQVANLIQALKLDPVKDAAAAALARRYAAVLELAEELADDAAKLAESATAQDAYDYGRRVTALEKKLAVVETIRTIGPLLLKTLGDLGGTPAGRKLLDLKGGAKPGGRLGQLRAGAPAPDEDPREV